MPAHHSCIPATYILSIFFFYLLQCYSLGVEDLAHLSGEEIHAKDSYLVFFNGLILGKHTRPNVCYSAFIFTDFACYS
jgi:hypothetical protein